MQPVYKKYETDTKKNFGKIEKCGSIIQAVQQIILHIHILKTLVMG